MLNKQQILESKDILTETVKVPEWGGEVLVRGITLAEKDDWTDSIMSDGKADIKGASAKLCVLCMRNEDDDSLIFGMDDVPALQEKSAAAMDRIFQVAQRLSGIGQEDIEETVKNSVETQTSDSD